MSTADGYSCEECGADLTERHALGVKDLEEWAYTARVRPDGSGGFAVSVSRDDAQFLKVDRHGVPYCTRCGLGQERMAGMKTEDDTYGA